jgi:hypothetical protein
MLLSDNLIKHLGRALRIIASKIWSKPTIMVRHSVSYTQALTLLLGSSQFWIGFSHVENGTAGMNAVEDNQLNMLAPGQSLLEQMLAEIVQDIFFLADIDPNMPRASLFLSRAPE